AALPSRTAEPGWRRPPSELCTHSMNRDAAHASPEMAIDAMSPYAAARQRDHLSVANCTVVGRQARKGRDQRRTGTRKHTSPLNARFSGLISPTH
ncbi:MAG TPA: hypothetical protein VE861_02500, partial [Gemmatimonadaceae bacterium]|nr:hypothetical protein [Gemmatimonadaceae bacterium]